MSVYIELVIFNNFAVDLLLEIATLTFFRKKIRWLRVILAAIVGACVATVYPLCDTAWQIVIRVLLAPMMVLIFDRVSDKGGKKHGKKVAKKNDNKAESRAKIRLQTVEYFKRLFVFCIATYFVGGITFGINFALNIDVASYWQFGVVAISLLTLLITVRIIVSRFSKSVRKICDATVSLCGNAVGLKALCDSGNTLTDTLSGLPVVILSKSAEEELAIPSESIEGYISVKTVSGSGELPIVRLDEVDVKGKTFIAYGALSRESYDDFEVILQNTMF